MLKYFCLSIILIISIHISAKAQFDFQDLEYPYTTKKITLDKGVELSYIDEGKGKQTILFIHGLGSYLPAWRKNIAELSKNYRCIAIDLPGYGKSSKGDYAYTMRFYADIIAELIAKLKLKNISLAGHSMGGQISITFALAYPEKLKNLILIAPAGLESFSIDEGKLLMAFTKPEMIQATADEKIESNLINNFYKMPEDAKFMSKDRISMKSAPDFPDYCKAVSKSVEAMLNGPVFQDLEKIKTNTLIVFGENDALIPNKYMHSTLNTKSVAETGKNKIPMSQLIMLKEAGHFVNFEKSEEVNQAIIDFLK